MRTSQLRTTAAVIRKCGKITVEEMALLLDCSIDTIKSVENGRMKLSDEVADKYEWRLGVDRDWFRGGDPKAPPLDWVGKPYDQEQFKWCVANRRDYDSADGDISHTLMSRALRLRKILDAADKARNFGFACFKIDKALDELERQFDALPLVRKAPTKMDLEGIGYSLEFEPAPDGVRPSAIPRPHPLQEAKILIYDVVRFLITEYGTTAVKEWHQQNPGRFEADWFELKPMFYRGTHPPVGIKEPSLFPSQSPQSKAKRPAKKPSKRPRKK